MHPKRPNQRRGIQSAGRLPTHNWDSEVAATQLAYLCAVGPMAKENLHFKGEGVVITPATNGGGRYKEGEHILGIGG